MRPKVKKSYGIACVRTNADGKNEILLVRKRYTYAYNDFVFGNYQVQNDVIAEMLNNMTVDEKVDLLSLNFTQIWYRVCLHKSFGPSYSTCKQKFEQIHMVDGGMRLRNMIRKSTSVDLLWEIPKGKKIKGEAKMVAAVREFGEETGLNKCDFKLLNGSFQYSYVDCGVKYNVTYYIARCVNDEHTVSAAIDGEISGVEWMCVEKIRHVSPGIVDKVKRIMRFAKHRW